MVALTDADYKSAIEVKHSGKIKVLGSYTGRRNRLDFMCNVCKHKWNALAGNVKAKSGCPKCAWVAISKSRSKSNETYQKEVKHIHNNKIKLLSVYVSDNSPIQFRCNVCKTAYTKQARALLGSPNACNVCYVNSRRLTHKAYIDKFNTKHCGALTVKGKYIDAISKIDVKCNECNYEWQPKAYCVLHNNGCPECALIRIGKNRRTTNNDFIKALKTAHKGSIVSLDSYELSNTKIRFKCKVCDKVWKAVPGNLIHNKSGCPDCAFHNKAGGYIRKIEVFGNHTFKVQGYEPIYLKEVIASGVKPRHIKHGNEVPTFQYKIKHLHVVSEHKYYPDFYLPKTNTIVEIKSTWTFCGTKKWFKQIKSKRNSVIEAGYDFQLIVYDRHGNRIELPHNWYIKTKVTTDRYIANKAN